MTPVELTDLLEEKRAEMLRIARARLRRHGLEADAEDFVQEGMIHLLNHADSLTPLEVGGWFRTYMLGAIRDQVGKETTRGRVKGELAIVYQPDSQGLMKWRERLKIDVELALGLLEDRTRHIVQMMWMEDYNRRSVVRLLKISEHTVTDALAEARPILEKALAKYDHRNRPASVPAEDRCLASQPPYKKESDETDTPMPEGGTGHEMTDLEMDALVLAVFEPYDALEVTGVAA